MSQKPKDIQSIAEEISNYLARHRFAADTVEGICHWWITKQRIEEEQKRVLAALDYLMQKNQVTSRRLPDGSLLYSAIEINPEQTRKKH